MILCLGSPDEKFFEEYLNKKSAAGVKPTTGDYNRVLAMCAVNLDSVGAQRVFDSMKTTGVKGNAASVRHLSQVYGNKCDVAGTESVVAAAAALRLEPGESLFPFAPAMAPTM